LSRGRSENCQLFLIITSAEHYSKIPAGPFNEKTRRQLLPDCLHQGHGRV
jgi:hypothetical protein